MMGSLTIANGMDIGSQDKKKTSVTMKIVQLSQIMSKGSNDSLYGAYSLIANAQHHAEYVILCAKNNDNGDLAYRDEPRANGLGKGI